MRRKFTKAQRQEIIDEYSARHGGFDAKGFLDEVRLSNGTHTAWPWFEWNDGDAAEEYRLWQARVFTTGLKIRFHVQVIERDAGMTMSLREVPALLSPLDGRRTGGGYFITDPEDAAHMRELQLQGAASLETWLRRYSHAYQLVGGNLEPFITAIALLRPEKDEEAAA